MFGRYAWGLIQADCNTFVYYEEVDEWKSQQQPGAAGGVLTMQVRTGNKVYQARIFGTDKRVEITLDLRRAIEADIAHQAGKRA